VTSAPQPRREHEQTRSRVEQRLPQWNATKRDEKRLRWSNGELSNRAHLRLSMMLSVTMMCLPSGRIDFA
jgi:hypothetical protein